MGRHVCLAAGGTGGHVLPAQAVAEDLERAGVSICFAGQGLSTNPFFIDGRWDAVDIPAARMGNPIQFIWRTMQGTAQALRLLRAKQPSCVVGFGSFHVVPVLVAAWLLRIPIVLYAADSVPGRVIRLFAPIASWTGCFFEEARSMLRGRSIPVAHPLRQSFMHAPSRACARDFFSLPREGVVLLVLGGSQGAKMLNSLVPAVVEKMDQRPSVIHLAGHSEDLVAMAERYRAMGVTAVVRAYETAMPSAYAAADLVIARAGASAIAEIEALGRPALYIPYPRALDDHQKKNALLAASRGPAIVLPEEEAQVGRVLDAVQQLLLETGQSARPRIHNPSFSSLLLQREVLS